MFGKVKVNGPETHPLFDLLKKRNWTLFRRKGQMEFHEIPRSKRWNDFKTFRPTTTSEQFGDEIASPLS